MVQGSTSKGQLVIGHAMWRISIEAPMELKSTMEGFGSSTDQHTDQHRNFRPAVRTVGPKAQ